MLEKIISIEESTEELCYDIEVSGNHLFYANNILTHNSNTDVDMTNTSDSIGIAMSLDYFFALIATDELSEMDQVLATVMKNRYGDTGKFVVGLKKSRMQFYNLEKSAQTSNIPKAPSNVKKSNEKDIPLFDRSQNRNLNTNDFKW